MSELEREVGLRDERLTDTLQQVTTAQDNLQVHRTIIPHPVLVFLLADMYCIMI